MAAVSCGPKGQLALLVDEASQQRFLVDTGSSYSILPHKSQQPHSGLRLCTADRSPIPCWGGRKVHVAAGGRRFSWTFLLADVALPIIGADFLKLSKTTKLILLDSLLQERHWVRKMFSGC